MGEKIQFNVSGNTIEGEIINFKAINEDWSEYQLENGTKIKVKIVVSKIVKSNEVNESGQPIYYIQSSNIVDATYSMNDKV